jgi:hypothetical protein
MTDLRSNVPGNLGKARVTKKCNVTSNLSYESFPGTLHNDFEIHGLLVCTEDASKMECRKKDWSK